MLKGKSLAGFKIMPFTVLFFYFFLFYLKISLTASCERAGALHRSEKMLFIVLFFFGFFVQNTYFGRNMSRDGRLHGSQRVVLFFYFILFFVKIIFDRNLLMSGSFHRSEKVLLTVLFYFSSFLC